jgi:hypothetical protein
MAVGSHVPCLIVQGPFIHGTSIAAAERTPVTANTAAGVASPLKKARNKDLFEGRLVRDNGSDSQAIYNVLVLTQRCIFLRIKADG